MRSCLENAIHLLSGETDDRSDAADVARRDDRRLAVGDGVAVELLVGGRVEQRLRVRRPDERALLVVEVGDLLRASCPSGSLIQISSRPERSETKAMYLPSADHFGDWLRDAILSGATRVMSPRSVAIVKICPRAEMTARRPDGERSNASTSLRDRLELDLVLLLVGGDVELDLARLARRDVELPDAEVVLVDDHLAVARHRRPEQAAVGVAWSPAPGWPPFAGIL